MTRHHPAVLQCILAGLVVVALAVGLASMLGREPMREWGQSLNWQGLGPDLLPALPAEHQVIKVEPKHLGERDDHVNGHRPTRGEPRLAVGNTFRQKRRNANA